MKKSTLILLVVGILFTTACLSQNEMRVGLNTGGTLSKFRGNELIKQADPNIGFLIGISFEVYFSEKLSLKTNLNYERKSFSYKTNEIDEIGLPINDFKVKTNFDYLMLPMLIKYEINSSKRFFASGGPFLGYLLSNKFKAKGFPDNNSTSLNKKIDIGLSFGIGKKIELDDKNDLSIELRDNFGLINISDVEVFRDGTIKTNSLNLILTWDFTM